jgi:hypothetical protein
VLEEATCDENSLRILGVALTSVSREGGSTQPCQAVLLRSQ